LAIASTLVLLSDFGIRFNESDGRTAIWLFRLSIHSGVAADRSDDRALDSGSEEKLDDENWCVLGEPSDWGDKNDGGGGNLKKVGEVGSAHVGEKGVPEFHSCCRWSRKCHGEAGIDIGVAGIDRGVTGVVNGAGSVSGGLDPAVVLEMSGFCSVINGGRFLGLFLRGSRRLLLPV
jgi:hypothetical protein